MVNELLIKAGFYTDNAFYAPAAELSFWSTPLGLACSLILCLTSFYRTVSRKSNVGLFDTLWHLALSLTAGAAFFTSFQHEPPQNIIKTMIILMAVRGIYKAFEVKRRCVHH